MKDLLNAGQVLGREEMKKLMAGSGGCGPSCSGCIKDNTSSGYPCVQWVCKDGGWCFPENSYCCIV